MCFSLAGQGWFESGCWQAFGRCSEVWRKWREIVQPASLECRRQGRTCRRRRDRLGRTSSSSGEALRGHGRPWHEGGRSRALSASSGASLVAKTLLPGRRDDVGWSYNWWLGLRLRVVKGRRGSPARAHSWVLASGEARSSGLDRWEVDRVAIQGCWRCLAIGVATAGGLCAVRQVVEFTTGGCRTRLRAGTSCFGTRVLQGCRSKTAHEPWGSAPLLT